MTNQTGKIISSKATFTHSKKTPLQVPRRPLRWNVFKIVSCVRANFLFRDGTHGRSRRGGDRGLGRGEETGVPGTPRKSSLTFELGVETVFEIGAGTKVDELELKVFQIDQEIFVFDVAMDDALAVTGEDGLDDLPEKVSGQLLLQDALLGDEVEKIFAARRLLHHVNEGVVSLVKVEQSDDARNGLDLRQKLQLEGHAMAVHLNRTRVKSQDSRIKNGVHQLTMSQSVTFDLKTCLMATFLPSLTRMPV